jgi:cardiolipin synthase
VLGPAEARIMGTAGLTLLVLALLALIWPRVIAVPLAAIALWVAVSVLIRARALRRERTSPPGEPPSAGSVRGRSRRRGERSA